MLWARSVFVPAYAKINLTLEVLGRRADGYHELASVMQTVALCDTIRLSPAPDEARTLACDVPELANDQNLALRAAHAVADALGSTRGVALDVHKAIPTQAGLGGGSSDAASVLLALTQLWDARLPKAQLEPLAATLGSDVPFFLTAGTASVTGRGERVTALPDLDPLWLVLLLPPVTVSTAAAFGALAPDDFASGAMTHQLVECIARRDPLPFDLLVNSFEPSIERASPAVAAANAAMRAAGAPLVRLSGSGPALFAPFRTLTAASEVIQRLRADHHIVWLTRTVGRAEARGHLGQVTEALR